MLALLVLVCLPILFNLAVGLIGILIALFVIVVAIVLISSTDPGAWNNIIGLIIGLPAIVLIYSKIESVIDKNLRDTEKKQAKEISPEEKYSEEQRIRNSFDCIQIALRENRHIVGQNIFSHEYRVTQPSGEEIVIDSFSELQNYYDNYK